MFKKPILFGPHMEDFAEVADLLLARAGACQVDDANALARNLADLLTCPDDAAQMGHRAFSVLEENAGAVDRTLAILSPLKTGGKYV
jgi:3-deoxy-D-manno-octulosonic-acid transferase